MSKFQWLMFLHLSGAFLLIGGAVVAASLNLAALRRERPSEIALLFGLIRLAVIVIVVGVLMTFGFGLWLVSTAGFDYSDGWIIAAIVLVIASSVMGRLGGGRDERTRKVAEELAAAGDIPSAVLHGRVHDRVSLFLSYGSGVLVIVTLALMVWKPGS